MSRATPPDPDSPAAAVSTEPPTWLVEAIARFAPSRATLLLRGGSPEEHQRVARTLHEASRRHGEPFVALDCRENDAQELERHLGGPVSQRPARLAVSVRGLGTLYLAAIERLPLLLQPWLMSFLDEDARPRVIASTFVDLDAVARDGRFRGDLAGRLLLVQLEVYPVDGPEASRR